MGDHGRWWNNPKVVDKLKLTDDQRTQIAAIVKAQFAAHKSEGHDAHAHGHDMMESFRSDTMAPAPAAEDLRARANKKADGFLSIATQVLPLLTPAQRSLAAAKIRARAQASEEEAPSLGE